MKFSKKVRYSLFGFLIALNIIMRYPFFPHEIGSDTFLIHAYAVSISNFGYATWIIHPYSYLGLTPDSYPSAVPFILSGMFQSMGVNMETAILIFSFVVGLLGLFGSTLLGKQIMNDDLFIFIVALIYSTSPVFLRFTIWTTATRHLFMGLFPFFIWGLLKLREVSEINWKYLGLTIFFIVMLLATHRMGILLFLIIFSFFVSILIFKYFRKLEFSVVIHRIATVFWFILLLILFLLQIFNLGIYNDINITYDYQSGQFYRGTDPVYILMNLAIDYGSRIGFLSLFSIIGFGVIFIKRRKSKSAPQVKRNFNEVFLILILLMSSSIMLLGEYLTLFLLPIFILLIGIGILWTLMLIKKIRWKIISKNIRIISFLFITILLIGSILFSSFMVQYWSKPVSYSTETKWLEDETIDSALFLNNYKEDHVYSTNLPLLTRKIDAWGKKPINYQIDLKSITIQKGGLYDLITEDTLYIKKGDQRETTSYFPNSNVTSKDTIELLERNGLRYIVEKKSNAGEYVLHNELTESLFLESMHSERYKLYENNLESIYFV